MSHISVMRTMPNGLPSTRRGGRSLAGRGRPGSNRLTGMQTRRLARVVPCMGVALLGSALLLPQDLPFEPAHNSGQSITGAFEGWFPNPDGSFSLLLGYYNRNQKQELEIPAGPNNRIEPGGPEHGH